jgi:hypothetical protein
MCDQKFDSQFDTKTSWRICKDSQLVCEVEIQGNILKHKALNFHLSKFGYEKLFS